MSMSLDIAALGPMLAVGVGAILLPIAEVLLARKRTFLSRPLTRERRGTFLAVGSLLCLVIALIVSFNGFVGPVRVFNMSNPMIVMDRVSHFLNIVVLLGAAMTVLVSVKYLADIRTNHGEYYALVMSSVLGMMFLTSATDLILLFLALELMSIPLYVLSGFQRESLRSNESALKYFLVGSFASAILLYGMALLYGATGSVSLAEIGARFDPESAIDMLGAALVLVGLGFKISSVPFHQWAPDVYEGAPTTVTGFMATTVKVAAFGALLRVLTLALEPASDVVYGALWVIAVLTMTVGNLMAIIQQNIKRMLAYSSIAHAGYVLVGLIVGTIEGYAAVLFYLLVYTFMTLGAFTVVAILAKGGEDRDRIDDLAGLGATRPLMAAAMAISMFALAGIPPTAGFMGKFQLFRAAIERGTETGDTSLFVLAILGVLNSAVSLAYYLRVPLVMYFREPDAKLTPDLPGFFERFVLLTCLAAIVLLGVVPGDVFVIFGDFDILSKTTAAAQQLLSPPSP